MSNASLGAVAFVAQVAQLLWAVPLALWADRGSRKLVAGLSLSFLPSSDRRWRSRPTCGRSRSCTWWRRSVRGEQHRPQLVSLRRLSRRGPGAGVQLAQSRPALADHRHPHLRLRRHRRPQLALRTSRRAGRHSRGLRALHVAGTGERSQREQPHPRRRRAWTCNPAGGGATGPPRLRHDPAVADPFALLRAGGRGHPRLRGHGRPLYGNLFLVDKFHLDTASRQRVLRHRRSGRLPGPPDGLFLRRPVSASSPAPVGRRRVLHRRLRLPLRGLALRPDSGWWADCNSWPMPPWRHWPSASSSPWPPPRRPRCGRSVSPCSASTRSSSGDRGLGGPRRGLRRDRGTARHRRVPHIIGPVSIDRRVPAHPRLAQRAT